MQTRKAACLLAVILASLAGLAAPAWAQSCGGSAGPPPAGGAAASSAWLEAGRIVARLSEEYESRDRSYKGTGRVDNDFDETLFVSRSALDVRYGLTDAWTVDLTLTYPHYTYRLKPPGGERRKFRFRGPGDTFLQVGRLVPLGTDPAAPADGASYPVDIPGLPTPDHRPSAPPSGPTLAIWGGVALPTGQPERPNPAIVTQDVSVSNLQTGTGTFDPLLRARLEWPVSPVTLFAEGALRYPVYENRYRYRTGDTETLAVGAGTTIVPGLSASLAFMGQRVTRDRFDGDDVGVGGARWIYLVPGVSWQATKDVAVDASVRLPVYRRTETKLSDSSVVYQVGLSFGF
jgi:hypothetical protein